MQTPANDVVWFFVADGVWNELLRATSSNIGSVANIDRFLQRYLVNYSYLMLKFLSTSRLNIGAYFTSS